LGCGSWRRAVLR